MLPTINIIKIVGAGSKPALAAQYFIGTVWNRPYVPRTGSCCNSIVTTDLTMETYNFKIAPIIAQ